MRLDYRYFLTEDRTSLVREDDPRAHSLMYPAGIEIPDEEAAKWGLLKPSPTLDKPEATKIVKPTSKEGK